MKEWSGVGALDAGNIPDKCVHELFMEAAQAHPDKNAVEFEDDEAQTLTYKQVHFISLPLGFGVKYNNSCL